jgi:hypothetical protein
MGNRDGTFDPCTPVDEQSSRSRGIALGDMNDNVDDNHNLDAVFANVGQYNQVCLGNGQGAFTNCVVVAGGADSLDVALSDLDRDGHLDAVFANTISNEVCLGDGDGTFAECAVLEPAISGNWGVALGDLDNDQNLDVVFANQ